MRAFRELEGANGCPGEHECTTDKVLGQIGSIHGQREGRTLENYCHNKVATKSNGLKTGCPLYGTKPENTPPSLYGAIEAAEILRRYKQRGTLPPISELSAWEYCCFDTAEAAADKIEAEVLSEANKGNGNKNAPKTATPLGISGEIEEGGAMSGW